MKVVYLGSPYTHSDAQVRGDRVEMASMAAAQLMMQGVCVFSPITHGHHVANHLPIATDHEFWMAQCKPILSLCDSLVILPIEGWRESRGLWEEIAFAREQSIPIFILQDLPFGFSRHVELLDEEEFEANGWQRLASE